MKNAMNVLASTLVLILVCAALGAAQVPPPAKEARDEFVRAYRIGPGDLLELRVFEVEGLSQTVRVEEDGTITLPLLGRVMVKGLTQEEVVQKLTDLLQAKYVKNPQALHN